MPRRITPETTLDGLKKEAKRWLRALRDTGQVALAAANRLRQSYPDAPSRPTLRAVQHALAREFGLSGWTTLKAQLEDRPSRSLAAHTDALVERFLEHACPDHHVRGGPSHVTAEAAAVRALADHPEIANASFVTKVVCGDIEGVARALRDRPSLAVEQRQVDGADRGGPGGESDRFRMLGPKVWEPILFLCFTRLPLGAVTDNAVPIARLLLDSGADPNVWFAAGGSRYTPLTGAVGEGEEGRRAHQRRDELVTLLLERGANPYDEQVLYNLHFSGRALWFLRMIYEETTRRGWAKDWEDPRWPKLGMGGYGPGSYYILKMAIVHDDLELAEWALSHGSSPNLPSADPPYHPAFRPKETLYELAVRSGRSRIADLLLRFGATRSDVRLTPEEDFNIAVATLDHSRAAAIATQHPEILRTTTAIFEAARRNRVDIVALLLELGMSANVENAQHQRPLHEAAFANSLDVASLLIAHGADIDPVGQWGGSPMGAASHGNRREMLALLAPLSHDIGEVNFAGAIDRLRQLLREKPERARIVTQDGDTLLMWLPYESEVTAIEAAMLLMSHGADSAAVNAGGQTAASRAEALGWHRLAAVLRGENSPGSGSLTISDYQERVDALLDAYHTGTPDALERHYRLTWHRRPWAGLRSYVQLDLGRHVDDPDRQRDITVDDARWLIAREHGYADWNELSAAVSRGATTGLVTARPIELIRSNRAPRAPRVTHRVWNDAVTRLESGEFDGIDAHGQATDAMLASLRDLDHLTTLKLGGSSGVTDEGLRAIAGLTRLRELDLGGTSITDAGLRVLGGLPNLEVVALGGTRITDAGVRILATAEHLEDVGLMRTSTGDEALAALRGKPRLRRLRTGNHVTDAGLRHIHDFPVFRTWQGGNESTTLTSYEDGPNHLFIRGPFTDAGLASLVGLDGLFGLNIDEPRLLITPQGLAPLVALPHLGRLAVDAKNESMPHLAAMPALKFLGIQDTEATDEGWFALSQSRSIEAIWGRRCHGLGTRGFVSLARIPTLRNLAVSCLNVSDDALATLSEFPALRELMPMDVPDEGYRHIARCRDLDRLTLMYCRDTGDRATEYIVALTKLRYYFVSYNKITDHSLELLSTMSSLEEIELSALAGISDAGVARLAALPRLRRLSLSGRHVTEPKAGVFPPTVEIHFDW